MLIAVVPVKSMDLAKSRLSGVLNATGRRALARQMLDHVLDTLHQAGIKSVNVEGGDDLNRDAALAAHRAQAAGATELLWVMADLPYLAVEDIAAMIEASRHTPPGSRAVVIAEAKDGGTNALLLRPPTAIGFAFSSSQPSGALHAAEARAKGIEPAILKRPGLARDIDTPADLALLAEHAAYRSYANVA